MKINFHNEVRSDSEMAHYRTMAAFLRRLIFQRPNYKRKETAKKLTLQTDQVERKGSFVHSSKRPFELSLHSSFCKISNKYELAQ